MTALQRPTNAEHSAELDQLADRVQRDHSVIAELSAFERRMRRLDEPRLVARASYLLARAELNAGRPDAALSRIDGARRAWLGCGETIEAARGSLTRFVPVPRAPRVLYCAHCQASRLESRASAGPHPAPS